MADGLMTWKYGTYSHPPGEVNLVRMEIIPEYSQNNQRIFTKYRMHVIGELVYSTQDTIKPRIEELIDVYANNYKDAGLYHTDGTKTRHFLQNDHSHNASGNIVEYRSWPKGDPDEYTTVRTFQIIISAKFLDVDSQLMVWRERIDVLGTGLPTWRWSHQWRPNSQGRAVLDSQQVVVQPFTTQMIFQHGFAQAATIYPVGNIPAPIFPDWEQQWKRRITSHDLTFQGRMHTGFGLGWAYTMAAPAFTSVSPNLGFSPQVAEAVHPFTPDNPYQPPYIVNIIPTTFT